MIEKRDRVLLEYTDFLIQRKTEFIKVFLAALVLSYLAVYVLIDEQYEAKALIIPREDEASLSAGSILRGVKGLPLGLGSKAVGSEMDLYNTVIYSRSMMEDVIREFDLLKLYDLDSENREDHEKAIQRLRKEITTFETEESAFEVTVRAGSSTLASDMTNFVVRKMSDRIIDLKVNRSRENRLFLEKRIGDLSQQLASSEDSLRAFQERTGLLDVKKQFEGILSANTSLETELTAKKFKKSILERMYDKESSEVKDVEMQIQEFQKNLDVLRSKGDPGSPLLPLRKLPQAGVEFLRRLRAVELNNLLMEYLVPLYEQAKIEEKKDYPIVQVIDNAVPPAKKSYPPRTLFALIGAFSVTLLVYTTLLMREKLKTITDERLLSVLKEAKRWTWKTQGPT